MNAAERLWRALAQRDWAGVRSQFHRSAVIERPAASERLDVDELVADHREHAARGDFEVEVLRSLNAGGTTIVIEARAGGARCAGIYDLHDGRIAGAVEYWVPPA
jgi:SnoaL-like domain